MCVCAMTPLMRCIRRRIRTRSCTRVLCFCLTVTSLYLVYDALFMAPARNQAARDIALYDQARVELMRVGGMGGMEVRAATRDTGREAAFIPFRYTPTLQSTFGRVSDSHFFLFLFVFSCWYLDVCS